MLRVFVYLHTYTFLRRWQCPSLNLFQIIKNPSTAIVVFPESSYFPGRDWSGISFGKHDNVQISANISCCVSDKYHTKLTLSHISVGITWKVNNNKPLLLICDTQYVYFMTSWKPYISSYSNFTLENISIKILQRCICYELDS